MARSLVLGNGTIFVGLDASGYVREFYFPFVGLENHLSPESKHRIGVWWNNQFSWLDSPDWRTSIDCLDDTMAGIMTKTNERLGIELSFTDIVYNETNVFLRQIQISHTHDSPQEIRIFFGQEFELYESNRGDTAYYDPGSHSIIHYKGRRVFLVNLRTENEGFDQYTTGIFNIYGKEGSFRDAEDGQLHQNPIEHGPCDSVLGITLHVPAHSKKSISYWLCAAESIDEAKQLNQLVLDKTPEHIIKTTTDYWRAWATRHTFSFEGLSDLAGKLFYKSLFYIRAHVDKRGAIIASGDTSMLQNGKDTYSYMWPRDAAFAALALDAAGDQSASRRFFEFCNDVITPEGYFMHKYLPDESLGSSWHPWVQNGEPILPIQEDETAIILFALEHHYRLTKDLEFVENLYNSLIKPAAGFLVRYQDQKTGLPKPSYDLWEEKYGTHTFTVASIIGALRSAAFFAETLGKTTDAKNFRHTAEGYSANLMHHLYDETHGYFRKSLRTASDGSITYDDTIDASSAYGVFMFGVLPEHDEKLQKAVRYTVQALTLPTRTKGIARYTGDTYFRSHPDVIGNPWFITTLWYAQYYAKTAQNESDLGEAKRILSWTASHASGSGILSEQLDPYSGERISSTPLTWSHVEYVRSVLAYLSAMERLGLCTSCNPIDL